MSLKHSWELPNYRRQLGALGCSLALLFAGNSLSYAAKQSATAEPKENSKSAEPDAGEPTLDELLGLNNTEGTAVEADEAGLPDVHETLNPTSKANQPPVSEMFLEALKAMSASASRLLERQDTGLITQRYQEEALLKLTMLIKQAEQQQQKKPAPNGSPKPQDAQPKPADPQQQSTPQPGAQAAQQDSRPAGRTAELEGEISENRTEWGSLPARVRDLLLQGRSESPASLYRRLTELYYKRLAEESEKDKPE